MRRLTWEGNDRFHLDTEPAPPPSPGHGEVLVRVRAVGICGTDIHILGGLGIGRPPLILGHEIAGEVVETGAAVDQIRPGDRVTVDQVIGCGSCPFCRRGSVQFCPDGYELGITRDGGCQDYIIVPDRNVYRVPESISLEEAAILDMEVWGAVRKAGIRAGDAVLVVGHGPAGMVACQLARAMGAGKVVLVGRSEARINSARKLQLADCYLSSVADDVAAAVARETGGTGADLVFECGGSAETVDLALAAVAPGGRVVFYGVQTRPLEQFDLNRIVLKDLAVFGALSDRAGWREVIDLVASGRLRLAPLITHRFPLEKAPEAYKLVRERAEGVIKAVLTL